ncbi:MAG: hypothetical protein AAF456_25050, partial [Planctomycetota bacterium]
MYSMIRFATLCFCVLLCFGVILSCSTLKGQDTTFANFESPQAHPIALSKDGQKLYAANTSAWSLDIYSLENPYQPEFEMAVQVGIEPVSLAVRNNDEVWVVNHVSDSVSVVNTVLGIVVDTIHIGDRPGDIVFGGQPQMAFVTSMSDRNVCVIDSVTREIVRRIPIHGNDPRTLSLSRDGSRVFVAISRSGNGTTIVPHSLAPPPPEPSNNSLPPAPQQGLIVKADDPDYNGNSTTVVSDDDVFEIDVATLEVERAYTGAGTILFNVAEHPQSGELWVANTEARNDVRFETQLNGHVIDNRVTVLSVDTETAVSAVVHDLNDGVTYVNLPDEKSLSRAVSQPTDIVFNSDGTGFIASFGTDRVVVVDKAANVVDTIDIDDDYVSETEPRNKRGPRAMVLHEESAALYVLNRLSTSISVIDTDRSRVVNEVAMFDPTPREIREGRGYLFDAKLSGNGTVSCASCHVDGDRDGLAWDLGDPGGEMFGSASADGIHPMKGPLLTQTLRGLDGERIFHWRADRPGLESFNGTFRTLMGGEELADEDMESFATYLSSIRFAPNPYRNLENELSSGLSGENALEGEEIFKRKRDVGREGGNTFRCIDCHSSRSGS